MGEEAGCLTENCGFLKNAKVQHYVAKRQEKILNSNEFRIFGDPPEIRTPDTLLKRQDAQFGLRPNKEPTEPAIENSMFLVMPYSKSTFGKGLWSTYLPWNNYTSFCSWIQRFRNIFIISHHLLSSSINYPSCSIIFPSSSSNYEKKKGKKIKNYFQKK